MDWVFDLMDSPWFGRTLVAGLAFVVAYVGWKGADMIWRLLPPGASHRCSDAATVTLVVIIYWPNWEPWKGLCSGWGL